MLDSRRLSRYHRIEWLVPRKTPCADGGPGTPPSNRSMALSSIWNKVLIGLIFVASLAFSYLAMRTLKTHQRWMQTAYEHVNGVGQGARLSAGHQVV